MDIKTIVRSQKLRHTLMRWGQVIPDRLMLPLQYYLVLHRWPKLNNPKRFTEWLQVYKIKYRNPLMLKCVDKFEVRDYVKKCLGSDNILNKLYQVCDKAEEIDFSSLPDKFVIKTTNGGSGDNVMIVDSKEDIDIKSVIEKVNGWLKKNYSNTSREWAYKNTSDNPRIIVEEKLYDETQNGLNDYKFFCFGGKVKYFKVDFDRFINHKANYYNLDLELMLFEERGFKSDSKFQLPPADVINQMINLSEQLSKEFPFARIDLYYVNGNIFFGEITFYPGSGYNDFIPESYDEVLGQYFEECKF